MQQKFASCSASVHLKSAAHLKWGGRLFHGLGPDSCPESVADDHQQRFLEKIQRVSAVTNHDLVTQNPADSTADLEDVWDVAFPCSRQVWHTWEGGRVRDSGGCWEIGNEGGENAAMKKKSPVWVRTGMDGKCFRPLGHLDIWKSLLLKGGRALLNDHFYQRPSSVNRCSRCCKIQKFNKASSVRGCSQCWKIQ